MTRTRYPPQQDIYRGKKQSCTITALKCKTKSINWSWEVL